MEYISTSEEICYFPLREKKKRNLESAISLIPNIKQTNSCFRCGVFCLFLFLYDELWVTGSQTEMFWVSKVHARWNYFGAYFSPNLCPLFISIIVLTCIPTLSFPLVRFLPYTTLKCPLSHSHVQSCLAFFFQILKTEV